uniref:aminotransferase class III-fold pyridoxal phosphate-dependent enzyme n=1 Tax=Empedobacter sp. TaxID=1927715 RepID=UPI0028AF8CB0
TDRIYQAFYADDLNKTLSHGHSFTASPLACTAALASLDLLLQTSIQQQIANIVHQHQHFVVSIQDHPKVKVIRQCGTILALEWNTNEETSYFSDIHEKLYPYFLEKGILLRPLGNIIYLVPPYCISTDDLNYIYDTIRQALIELF